MTWRILITLLMLVTPVWAVEPDEILPDPALESRAREISKELRCLVCRNENIDSSNAGIAKDLRLLVRERLVAGDEDSEVVDFIVDRYGEFVLLKPRFSLANLLLWAIGPIALLIGGLVAFGFVRRRPTAAPEGLSEAEQNRLDELLKG
ncbi:MAG: cytochrome c-type biogenesis protein CcmH [Rhodobacteraceae bacterium]|nr:cytochrome c-type biogenesis protein CcmH [Paracoccaceae bacterium]